VGQVSVKQTYTLQTLV